MAWARACMSRQKNCKHKHLKRERSVWGGKREWNRMCQWTGKESLLLLFKQHSIQKIFHFWKLRWIFHFHYDANYRMNERQFMCVKPSSLHIASRSENAKSLFAGFEEGKKNLLTLTRTWPSNVCDSTIVPVQCNFHSSSVRNLFPIQTV